jgi:hypothetical protein
LIHSGSVFRGLSISGRVSCLLEFFFSGSFLLFQFLLDLFRGSGFDDIDVEFRGATFVPQPIGKGLHVVFGFEEVGQPITRAEVIA